MNLPQTSVRWAETLLAALVVVLLLGRAVPAGAVTALPPASELAHRVDLNEAPWYELTNLPGIGEARARAIVAEREARGPFASPGDLERVPGIGPVTVREVRGLVKEACR